MTLLQILAAILVVVGTTFSVIGVLGYRRLPDVYARLHATGKVGILGVVLLLGAAALATPLSWSKALVLILLLLASGPITAHTLGSTAHRLKVPVTDAQRNDLHHE